MGLLQTENFLHSKGNHQQNEKAIYWMGEDSCKWYIWSGVNIQNIWRTHTSQHQKTQTIQLKNGQGLPWWRSGWESACQCRGHGFGSWSGRIPHAAERLGPWATTTEPARLEPVLRNERGRDSERPAHRDEEWPLLAAAGGSPRAETETQHSQK